MNALDSYKLGSDLGTDFSKRTISLLKKLCLVIKSESTINGYSIIDAQKRQAKAELVLNDKGLTEAQIFIQAISSTGNMNYTFSGDTPIYGGADEDGDIATELNNVFDQVAGTTDLTEREQRATAWVASEDIELGWLRVEAKITYRCIQSHTTQVGWEPSATIETFWVALNEQPPGQTYPNWVRPTGGHNGYDIGDRVHHNGSDWDNTATQNAKEPGTGNSNWTLLP